MWSVSRTATKIDGLIAAFSLYVMILLNKEIFEQKNETNDGSRISLIIYVTIINIDLSFNNSNGIAKVNMEIGRKISLAL